MTEHWPAPSVTQDVTLGVPYELVKSTVLPTAAPPTTRYVTLTARVVSFVGASTGLRLGVSTTVTGPRNVTDTEFEGVASGVVGALAVTPTTPGPELASVTLH